VEREKAHAMNVVDDTHDPARRSWVASANEPATDFPLQNLPFGRFRRVGEPWRLGVAVGDQILDLRAALKAGLELQPALGDDTLNAYMAAGRAAHRRTRALLSGVLAEGSAHASSLQRCLVPQAQAQLGLPVLVGGYTDFLTSRHHAERHGRLKGLKDLLPPACLSLPVAYHGRTSTLRASGTEVVRPQGQYLDTDGRTVFGPVQALDFELEVAAFIGAGNPLAEPIALDNAPAHLFGYCLLNDWSAKDVQWWEQVLGPFLGKNFMTSLSPWVVTAEALAPFHCAPVPRSTDDPPLLPYLHSALDRAHGALDLQLEAWLVTPVMRQRGEAGARLTRTSTRHLDWTFAQMLTHHASNGCQLMPGDLIGSGTVSGPERETMACMTEMTQAGREPIVLPGGETRRWLLDGDEIVLRARAQRPGFAAIGFGECRGRIVPARPWPGA
jgi:fumarylacetoacetase